MSTQQLLPLEPELLTDWMNGPPPCSGWWNTRAPGFEEPIDPPLRRYFNGLHWSRAVHMTDSDLYCERTKRSKSIYAVHQIQYQGLAQPPQEVPHQPQRRRLAA